MKERAFQTLNAVIAIADAARDSRDWHAAEEFYRRALEGEPTLAALWIQFGHALKEQKKLAEAEAAYLKATELDPTSGDGFLQLGHLRKLQGSARLAEENYAQALELDPRSSDARRELLASGWTLRRIRPLIRASRAASVGHGSPVAFELTDLVEFLQHSKHPTGIQRVQLELACALYKAAENVEFVFFDVARGVWLGIERTRIREIVDLMRDPYGLSDVERAATASRIREGIKSEDDFIFLSGSTLVNLGTSWGFINYFSSLRAAQRQFGLRYAPFIHDCIPLIYPESCGDLIGDFINWLDGMLGHAEFVLANSENTKSDFLKAAAALEVEPPDCVTVYLNGRFEVVEAEGAESEALDLLRKHALDFSDFVLFVSSIEPRKNHMLGLAAWSRMIKSRSSDEVPLLVCVGSSGWHNESFYRTLERNEALAKKVIVLNNVSDQCLKLLYERCLFTIYPSLYEGWGLPVTESISHGKAALVSNISSLPEAGTDLAIYFALNSEADFSEKLERLIYDKKFRQECEQRIAAAPKLRCWEDIGAEILGVVRSRVGSGADQGESGPPRAPSRKIVCGRYYSFARNAAKTVAEMNNNGDRFRDGGSWLSPEYWGCWIGEGYGDISFSLAGEAADKFFVYLHLIGTPNLDNVVAIRLASTAWSKKTPVPRDKAIWERLSLSFSPGSKREVRIRISPELVDDFTLATEGRDARRAGLGIKGIYVCACDDISGRLALSEAIATGSLAAIASRFSRSPIL